MAKAKLIGKVYDKNPFNKGIRPVTFIYEYRGYEYMITDERNGYSEPMSVKHRNEQARIDRIIEESKRPKKETRYEDTAEYGFDLLWDYFEE